MISKLIQRLPPWAWGSANPVAYVEKNFAVGLLAQRRGVVEPVAGEGSLEMKIGTMKFSFRSETAV